jgi:FkbM family methyltransferase
MKTREGTYDEYILKEIARTYGWMDVKDKVVMDIGACFGAAACFFADKGAEKVCSYEPEPDNYRLLIENVGDRKIFCYGVGISDKEEIISFYVNEAGMNKGSHTTRPTRGRKEIKIETLSFDRQLELHRPEVLKIDCEGAEYTFLTKPLPDFVKQVTLEIHRTNKEYIEKARELVKLFADWECVKEPKLDGGHWQTIGAWRRK